MSSTEREKLTALFKNLVVLAHADKDLAPQESKILTRVGRILGFSNEQVSEIMRNVKQEEFHETLFLSQEDIRQLFQFMLFVALADGKITADEKAYLRRVAVRAKLDKKTFDEMWRHCRREVELIFRSPALRKSSLTEIIQRIADYGGKQVRAEVEVASVTPLTHERTDFLFNGNDPANPEGAGVFLRVPRNSSLAQMFLASQKSIPMDIVAAVEGEVYGRPVLRVLKARVIKME